MFYANSVTYIVTYNWDSSQEIQTLLQAYNNALTSLQSRSLISAFVIHDLGSKMAKLASDNIPLF